MHPSEPILAILHAGYGEHEVVTAGRRDGKDHRPREPCPRRSPAWSGRPTASSSSWAAAATIGSIASTMRAACSRTRSSFPYPQPGWSARQVPGRPGPVERRQDPLGRQRPSATRVARLDTSDRARSASLIAARGRFLPLWPGLGRDRATALREPLEPGRGGRDRHRDDRRSSATIATSGASQRAAPGPRAARSSTSPTPTATPSGSSTPRPARRSRRSARPSTPRPPRAARPARWRCRPTRRSCSSPTPTPTTWPS